MGGSDNDREPMDMRDLFPIDVLEDESFDYRSRLAPWRGAGERPARADRDIEQWQRRRKNGAAREGDCAL